MTASSFIRDKVVGVDFNITSELSHGFHYGNVSVWV